MRSLFSEYGKTILVAILVPIIIGILFASLALLSEGVSSYILRVVDYV